MKRLLLVLCLAGCAQLPQEPTEGQKGLAEKIIKQCWDEGARDEGSMKICTDLKIIPIHAFFAEQCKSEGIDPTNWTVLLGCVMAKAVRADSEYRAGRQPPTNVLIESGRVLSTPTTPQTQRCSTRPDYAGGWTTACY